MKKIIPIILILLLVVAGALLVKKRKASIKNATLAIPVSYTIRTTLPQTRTVTQTVPVLAKLEPTTQSTLSTKLSGQITNMAVSESQKVQKGDLLVQIDDGELQAGLSGLKSNLIAAKKQHQYNVALYQRNQTLFDAGGLPQEKLEASAVALASASAALQGLEQQIQALESQLEYTQIKAPFSGTIGTRFQKEGDLAAPGKPILSLNSETQKLTFTFAPDSSGIQAGQTVLWRGAQIGTLAKLYADAQGGLTVAEVALTKPIDQPNGSFLSVEVATRTETGPSVPLTSILHRNHKTSVMLQQNENSFQPLEVVVLAQDSEFAVVEPAPSSPVAVAAESKLALLPFAQGIRIITGDSNE